MKLYFKRRNYYGKTMGVPAWHIHEDTYPGDFSPFVALCGYRQSNTIGRLLFSHGKPDKEAGGVCRKCAAKLAAATPLT